MLPLWDIGVISSSNLRAYRENGVISRKAFQTGNHHTEEDLRKLSPAPPPFVLIILNDFINPTSKEGTEGQENEENEAQTNSTSKDQKLCLTYMKSTSGILNIVIMVTSFLCLIILGASKRIDCFVAFTSSYEFFNFAFSSCLIIYTFKFVIYGFSLNTKLLCRMCPCLIWNLAKCLFFVLMFFTSSIGVLANACGSYYGGYKAAGAFGFITFALMVGDFVYNIILLRRDHPPTENKVLLMLGVERKPPATASSYNKSEEEAKY